MSNGETGGANGKGAVITIKSWQALLTVVGWLVISVLHFAYVQAQTQQNAKDVEEIKRNSVTKDRFEEMREDIQRRLQRIEDKLDRERAIRELH